MAGWAFDYPVKGIELDIEPAIFRIWYSVDETTLVVVDDTRE